MAQDRHQPADYCADEQLTYRVTFIFVSLIYGDCTNETCSH